MFEKWVVGLVISFILRQLAKFTAMVDWAKVSLDAQARIADLLPGTFFDDEGKAMVATLVGAAKAVLTSTAEWEKILALLAADKGKEAFDALLTLLKNQWQPAPTDIYAQRAKLALAAV